MLRNNNRSLFLKMIQSIYVKSLTCKLCQIPELMNHSKNLYQICISFQVIRSFSTIEIVQYLNVRISID